MKRLLIAIVAAVSMSACGGGPAPTPLVVTATARPSTDTPVPTAIIEATPSEELYGVWTNGECQSAWLRARANNSDLEASAMVDLILNRDWAPDSIGAVIKTCINDGWDRWRRTPEAP